MAAPLPGLGRIAFGPGWTEAYFQAFPSPRAAVRGRSALRVQHEAPALILRSRVSGVSKDAPDVSGTSWNILRDAISDEMAPQDEGSEFEGAGRLFTPLASLLRRVQNGPEEVLRTRHTAPT